MKHIELNDFLETTQSLESLDERIAIESQFLSNIAMTVRDVIPSVIFGAKKILNHFQKLEKPDMRMLDFNTTSFTRIIDKTNYANLTEVTAIAPEGFSSYYDQLCQTLVSNAGYANNVSPRLTDYAKFISAVISSQDSRKALGDYSAIMKAVDKERDAANSAYSAHFTPGSVKSVRKYGDIIENNTLWLSCIPMLESAMAEARQFKTSDIQHQVDVVSELLDGLNERVKNGTANDFTPETLRTLSAMTITMAREVEFYGLTMYRLSEAKRCYEETCKNLLKSLGK